MSTVDSGTAWQNWARNESAHPTRVSYPRDIDELARTVRGAEGLRVRAVGSGHSFTGVAVTDGIHLHLDALSGVEQIVRRPDGTAHVTVGGGTRLVDLNRELAALGLAMRNLGDIDRQTVAGAVSTGTHGTGARLRGLADQVVGARLVTAEGEVLETSATEHGDLFQVARLGLGSVGVIAALTFEVVPAFRLRADEAPADLDDVLAALDGPDGLVEANDHFEFYWFPHTRRVLTKRNNRAGDHEEAPLGRIRGWVDDELFSNGVFAVTNRLAAAVPATTARLNGVAARALTARSYVAPSAAVFISRRRVRFREMEYAVPRAAVPAVLAEIDRWLHASGERVHFPLEVRFAAADDLWLSTATGRDSAYIAVHQYVGLPYERYFRAVERIVAPYDARPHWGKLHWLDADRLATLYPRFADVQAVRAAADPRGVFTNPYLDRVLGPVATSL